MTVPAAPMPTHAEYAIPIGICLAATAKRKMLVAIARETRTEGTRFRNPSVYLRPTAQPTSRSPAMIKSTQDMTPPDCVASSCRNRVRRTSSGYHNVRKNRKWGYIGMQGGSGVSPPDWLTAGSKAEPDAGVEFEPVQGHIAPMVGRLRLDNGDPFAVVSVFADIAQNEPPIDSHSQESVDGIIPTQIRGHGIIGRLKQVADSIIGPGTPNSEPTCSYSCDQQAEPARVHSGEESGPDIDE